MGMCEGRARWSDESRRVVCVVSRVRSHRGGAALCDEHESPRAQGFRSLCGIHVFYHS